MKKFSKVRFLQSVGFLNAKLDYQTLRFERSRYLRFKCHLTFLITLSAIVRMCISPLFEREDPRQLHIGSIYNMLTGAARNFVGWIVSMRFSLRNFLVDDL